MIPRIFFSDTSPSGNSTNLVPLLREAMGFLFPNAVPFDWPDGSLKSDHSLFFRNTEGIVWLEFVTVPFSRNEITNYLAKARQIQSLCSSGIAGVLAAPDFEAGVRELLELIRIPTRFLHYQEIAPLGRLGRSPHESALWIQELTTSHSPESAAALPTLQNENPQVDVLPPSLRPSWNRLSREELREFIQLELDLAGRVPTHK